MKVLQIIDSLNVGGAERMFVTLTNLLHKKEVDVHYLVFTPNTTLEKDILKDVTKVSYQRNSKYSYKSLRALSKIISHYDIVHVHMRHVFRYVQLVAKLFGISSKIILHDHSNNTQKLLFQLDGFFKPKYYIGVSETVTDWFQKKIQLSSTQVFVLPNCIVKEEYSKNNNKGFVLVGNIKSEKNQLFALKLLTKIDAELTLIGNIQDKVYHQELLNFIETNRLKNRVHFLHNLTAVQKELTNFKFGLHTSEKESGPIVLIEYVAQNLPFLAYKTGEVSDILYKDLPSFFVTNFNEEEWIRRIQAIETKEVENFNEIYQRNFSPENYTTKCLKIYQQIINS